MILPSDFVSLYWVASLEQVSRHMYRLSSNTPLSLSFLCIGYVMINGTIGYPDNFQYVNEEYRVSYTNVSCSNSYTSCNGTQFSSCTDNGGLLSLRCSYGKI